MHRLAPFALLAFSLGGCAQGEMVGLRNTTTGEFARCELADGPSNSPFFFRSTRIWACPTDLAAAGWVRTD